MEYVFMETPWVTGIPKAFGGGGDPSPYTAHGVLMGMKAAVKYRLGQDSLAGLRIAVQGLGSVGSHLVEYLYHEKAQIFVADIDHERVQRMSEKYNATAVDADEIVTFDCDVLAPCALGAVVNDQTLPKLRCKAIAGGANNQLAEVRHGALLRERGILYTPDYVINAGGLMNVFVELEGYSAERALEKTQAVYENCMQVFKIADAQKIATNVAADHMAEERIHTISKLRTQFQGRAAARPFTTLREINNR
jgi:leucine dehydrogenase